MACLFRDDLFQQIDNCGICHDSFNYAEKMSLLEYMIGLHMDENNTFF